jgi:DNA-directed RNA polymerase subunit RPC12/RpoP
MMFKFRCMHCDRKIVVPTEFSGRHVRCPGCAQSTIVPFPSPEELEAAEETGFHIRANPTMAFASRACKSCGATMPRSGPCIHCGADPGDALKAAFDASLATILPAPPLAAASAAQGQRGRAAPGNWWRLAAVILLAAAALCAAIYALR